MTLWFTTIALYTIYQQKYQPWNQPHASFTMSVGLVSPNHACLQNVTQNSSATLFVYTLSQPSCKKSAAFKKSCTKVVKSHVAMAITPGVVCGQGNMQFHIPLKLQAKLLKYGALYQLDDSARITVTYCMLQTFTDKHIGKHYYICNDNVDINT